MKHALMTLIGVIVYCGGAALFGYCLLLLGEDNLTSPIQLPMLALGSIIGLLSSIIGFIYAWESMKKM